MPAWSYARMCVGGTQFVEGDSSTCEIKADWYKPLLGMMEEDQLMMNIRHSTGEVLYLVDLASLFSLYKDKYSMLMKPLSLICKK